LRAAATQFGRRIVAVPSDQHGMVPELLEQACSQHRPGLIYLNPTLQNPTAITMPERRRKELASIARRCQVRIVEDDPYWLLADAPPPPLATLVPQQVYYISTLSKCLTPGLRVAFVLIRDPHERERFLVALRSFALMAAPLMAALATQWIFDGTAEGLMAGVRKEARLRHRMAGDILAGRYSGAGDGLHVWLELPALELFTAGACRRQRGPRRHAGGGICNGQRVGECNPHFFGQHQGSWALAGGAATLVSSACAAARVVQCGGGLTVRETLCFMRELSPCSGTFRCRQQTFSSYAKIAVFANFRQ